MRIIKKIKDWFLEMKVKSNEERLKKIELLIKKFEIAFQEEENPPENAGWDHKNLLKQIVTNTLVQLYLNDINLDFRYIQRLPYWKDFKARDFYKEARSMMVKEGFHMTKWQKETFVGI